MRSGNPILRTAFVLAASAAVCSATTINDIFNQPQTNCNYSADSPYGTCDVIGDPQSFDAQAVSFSTTGGMASLLIYLNTASAQKVNNKYTLVPFSDSGLTLIPGDVFFYSTSAVYDPSDPNTTNYLKYGLALTDHGNFLAGDLYAISGGVSVETAQQALNFSSDYYRRNEAVLMTGSGTAVSSGTVSVAPYGDGITSAKYVVTVTFPTTTAFLDLMTNTQLGLLFSSADCGNDVVQGTVSSVPEPGPGALMFIGMAFLVAGRWRKKAR